MEPLRPFSIIGLAQFQAILGGILGFLAGIIYSIGGLLVDFFVSLGLASSSYWETPGLSWGTIMAMGALVGMPAIGVVFGFLLGLILGPFYRIYLRINPPPVN